MDVGQPVHGARVWVPGRGSTRVGYGWVGTWVGYTGSLPTSVKRSTRQRSGPGSPCRGWSGGLVHSAPGSHRPPTPLRSGARSAVCGTLPGNAASWPIRARLRSISENVSQNDQVSPKSIKKACHSPYFQNRLQKSPLEILRFLFSPAFSPKELMGHI